MITSASRLFFVRIYTYASYGRIRYRHMQHQNAIHVLALDGGGMRGLYTASVLETVSTRIAEAKSELPHNVGKAFDLIAGTSTGAILAAGLANGVSLSAIKELYCEHGEQIFPDPIPEYHRSLRLWLKFRFFLWCIRHRNKPGSDGKRLRRALSDIFGTTTLGELYARTKVGLCITATTLHNHEPRVFKTSHLSNNHKRDNNLTLVDACLASAAAPVFLPLSSTNGKSNAERHIYADGGLWANNPVVIAITEALAMASDTQPIRILSVGTCPPPVGEAPDTLNRGLKDWKVGVGTLELSMNAQSRAAHYQAEHLVKQLKRFGRDIELYRFHESPLSTDAARSVGLDNASKRGREILIRHGVEDGTTAFKEVQNNTQAGRLIQEVFARMPTLTTKESDNSR